MQKNEYSILGEKFVVRNPKLDKGFVDHLNGIIEAENALEEIGCNILIPYPELTESDWKQISLLCRIRRGQVGFDTETDVFSYNWTFRDKYWPIIVDRSGEDIKICGFVFEKKNMFSIGVGDNEDTHEMSFEGPYLVPNFLTLDSKVLANLYWYDYESMYEQIDRSVVNNYTSGELNDLALRLIMAYDLCQDAKLLDLANYILKRLYEVNTGAPEYTINLCQIEMRKKATLTQESRNKLSEIEESLSSESDSVIKYCIAVVKGDISNADKSYNLFTDTEKTHIDDWPIRNLHLLLRERVNLP